MKHKQPYIKGLQRAVNVARKYISYRLRSESEVRLRLSVDFQDDLVEEAISQMYRESLLDDERFARVFTESKSGNRPFSSSAIRQQLKTKGISPELTNSVTASLCDKEGAIKVARKKSRSLSHLPYESYIRKMYSHLRRRGFDHDITKDAITRSWEFQKL